MKKIIVALALVAVGSVANANPVFMNSIKCSEYNQQLDIHTDYLIYIDIEKDSNKGIIVSNLDGLSIAYNVNIKTKGDFYLEAIADSKLVTEVISVNLGNNISGVRTVTLKKPANGNNQKPFQYLLKCDVIEGLE